MWPTILIEAGMKLIDKLFPDPAAKAEAQLKLLQLQQTGELAEMNANLQLAQGQMDINKTEAANPNLFVSGWRPAIGWVAALSLFMYYVPYCLVATIIWARQCMLTGVLVSRPDLGISDLIGLVAAMLGIASMRTYEKVKGVVNNGR